MSPGTRLALLADVHGNGDALHAVLADLDERGLIVQRHDLRPAKHLQRT